MIKYFNKKNFLKVIIIFTVGFVSRILVNDYFGINVYFDCLHSVSLIYYALLSIFIVLVHEYLIYVEFNILSSIFKIIHTILKYSIKYIDYYCKNIRILLIRKVFNSYNNSSLSKMYINDSSSSSSKNVELPDSIVNSSKNFVHKPAIPYSGFKPMYPIAYSDDSINVIPKSYNGPNGDKVRTKLPANRPTLLSDMNTVSKSNTIPLEISSISNNESSVTTKHTLLPKGNIPSSPNFDDSKNSVDNTELGLSNIYNKELAIGAENESQRGWNHHDAYKNFRAKCNDDFNEYMRKNRNTYNYPYTSLKYGHGKFMSELSKGVSLDKAAMKLPPRFREPYKQYLLGLEKERDNRYNIS